jgi:uncharacterized membrane protein
MKRSLVVVGSMVVALSLMGMFVPVARSATSVPATPTVSYYACVGNLLGVVRIVTATTACLPSEYKISLLRPSMHQR